MDNRIDIRHVDTFYGEQKILHDVSYQVKDGEFAVIIGSSGCGKTTLLKMINGLVAPAQGEVIVGGENIRNCDLISLRKQIGYAVQGARLFPHLTVEDNICYVPALSEKMSREQKQCLSEEMLELVKLPAGLRKRFPAQLSGGQQQRVGIARALANRPTILLMDEPFGAVDEITRKELQQELIQLRKQMRITVVFITHDIGEAVRLADKISVMQEGRILQEGTPQELRNNPEGPFVRRLFDIEETSKY